MNIALIFQHKLVQGLQRWMQGGSQPAASLALASGSMPAPYQRHTLRRYEGTGHAGMPASRHTAHKVMPLRVLHVVESGQSRSSTGRMVISGRMADVCAELDRLVEREAALH